MTTPSTRPAMPWHFVAALLFAAVNLRAPFVAVAPISGEIAQGFGVGAGSVGLLTTVPVFAFGLAAPLALLVARRLGAELGLALCLTAVVVGGVLRSAGPYGLALAATFLMGLGITIGNIVVPVIIRRDVPAQRAGLVTGLYTSTFNVGSMLATVVTAPLAAAIGWRLALASGVLVAVPALLVWLTVLNRRRLTQVAPAPRAVGETGPVWRNPLAWLLGISFGAQAWSYYALTAWLPSLLADELGLGAEAAGVAASVFQICAIAGAVGAPLLATRLPSWTVVAGIGIAWIVCPVVLLVDPHWFLLACIVGGVAQGGGITVIFTAVVGISRTDRESAQLSAFVQGAGYVLGAWGPSVVGLSHDLTGRWTLPLIIVLLTTTIFTITTTVATFKVARLAA